MVFLELAGFSLLFEYLKTAVATTEHLFLVIYTLGLFCVSPCLKATENKSFKIQNVVGMFFLLLSYNILGKNQNLLWLPLLHLLYSFSTLFHIQKGKTLTQVFKYLILLVYFILGAKQIVAFEISGQEQFLLYFLVLPSLYYLYAVIRGRYNDLSDYSSLNFLMYNMLMSLPYVDYIGGSIIKEQDIPLILVIALGAILTQLVSRVIRSDRHQWFGLGQLAFGIAMLGLFNLELRYKVEIYYMVVLLHFLRLHVLPRNPLGKLLNQFATISVLMALIINSNLDRSPMASSIFLICISSVITKTPFSLSNKSSIVFTLISNALRSFK